MNDHLEGGRSLDDFLPGHPAVERWHIEAFFAPSPEALDPWIATDGASRDQSVRARHQRIRDFSWHRRALETRDFLHEVATG